MKSNILLPFFLIIEMVTLTDNLELGEGVGKVTRRFTESRFIALTLYRNYDLLNDLFTKNVILQMTFVMKINYSR